jgi:type II secretory pathway pseudopilin PulG
VRRARREAGYALVALVASVTIMLIFMAAAVPAWRYVIKRDREEELFFRGGQIADAIKRYQFETQALPVSMDMLLKGRRKYLRRPYKDPMMPDGKWRLVPINMPCPVPSGGIPGLSNRPSPAPSPPPAPGSGTGAPGQGDVFGPFQGVVSRSAEKSLGLMNGQHEVYSNWCFIAGQPRWMGKRLDMPGARPSPGPGGGGNSGDKGR